MSRENPVPVALHVETLVVRGLNAADCVTLRRQLAAALEPALAEQASALALAGHRRIPLRETHLSGVPPRAATAQAPAIAAAIVRSVVGSEGGGRD